MKKFKDVDWGEVFLYVMTAICFAAIGALIGLWSMVL